MKIRLIRHGITDANEKGLYCGSTDLPLCPRGVDELKRFKEESSAIPADLYVTSGLTRAIQTLEILYERKPDIIMPDFNEMDFGDFEMKCHDELIHNSDYISWLNDNDTFYCPGGESRLIFKERVKRGLGELLSRSAENVLVVAHGGVIVTIMDTLFQNQKTFYEWQPQNGMGYMLEFNEDRVITWTS